jgi:hypothetical protein
VSKGLGDVGVGILFWACKDVVVNLPGKVIEPAPCSVAAFGPIGSESGAGQPRAGSSPHIKQLLILRTSEVAQEGIQQQLLLL